MTSSCASNIFPRVCWGTKSLNSLFPISTSISQVAVFIGSFVGLYAFPCARASKLNQQICMSPAPGRSSKLTHTGVEIDTCAFQTGCQLSSAASGMSLELRFLTQLQWHEAHVLDNWQLAEMPQSGGREFDPRRVHDNLSVPLWVYMRFPVPEHQN